MQKVMQAYFNTTATTTSPGDVIVMLYDGAISFLERAKQKIIEKDYAQKGILISKAMDVIGELDSSLNIEKGGNLAENLHSLYFFCNTHLLQANLKMDTEKIDKVITILTDLRDAFATIVNTPEAVQAAQTNAMTQRAQAPQVRGTINNGSATASIGNARASSLYAKNSQAFTSQQQPHEAQPAPAMAQPAPAMAQTAPIKAASPLSEQGIASSGQSIPQPGKSTGGMSKAETPAPGTVDTSPTAQSTQVFPQASLQTSQPAENTDPKATVPSTTDGQTEQQPVQQTETLSPPQSRLESRFQGAALYKKFAQN